MDIASSVTRRLVAMDPIDMLIALVGAIVFPFTVSAMSAVVPHARASQLMETSGEVMVRCAAHGVLLAMYSIEALGAYYYYTN